MYCPYYIHGPTCVAREENSTWMHSSYLTREHPGFAAQEEEQHSQALFFARGHHGMVLQNGMCNASDRQDILHSVGLLRNGMHCIIIRKMGGRFDDEMYG